MRERVDPSSPGRDLRGEARVDEDRRLRPKGRVEISAREERREIPGPRNLDGRDAGDLEIAAPAIDLAPERRRERGER